MKRIDTELLVGLFMIVGITCLTYLSIKLGKKTKRRDDNETD